MTSCDQVSKGTGVAVAGVEVWAGLSLQQESNPSLCSWGALELSPGPVVNSHSLHIPSLVDVFPLIHYQDSPSQMAVYLLVGKSHK